MCEIFSTADVKRLMRGGIKKWAKFVFRLDIIPRGLVLWYAVFLCVVHRFAGREQLDPRSLALGIVPNVVNFAITVHVTDVNDPPAILYLPGRHTEL